WVAAHRAADGAGAPARSVRAAARTRGLARALVASAIALACTVVPNPGEGQSPPFPPAAEQVTPDPWPRTIERGGAKFSLYQPQVDRWDAPHIEAHAAVSVQAAGDKEPVFGIIAILAETEVDRESRTVYFREIRIAKATVPSAPAKAGQYRDGFQAMVSGGRSTMSLDRLEAMLAIEGAEKKAQSVPVVNEPPRIVFSHPSPILIPIAPPPPCPPLPAPPPPPA